MSVEFIQAEPGAFDHRRYDVYFKGALVGAVALRDFTWERKTKGNRYVTARGSTKKWCVIAGGHSARVDYRTRKEAVRALVRWMT